MDDTIFATVGAFKRIRLGSARKKYAMVITAIIQVESGVGKFNSFLVDGKNFPNILINMGNKSGRNKVANFG